MLARGVILSAYNKEFEARVEFEEGDEELITFKNTIVATLDRNRIEPGIEFEWDVDNCIIYILEFPPWTEEEIENAKKKAREWILDV